jgi:hypothetical protein
MYETDLSVYLRFLYIRMVKHEVSCAVRRTSKVIVTDDQALFGCLRNRVSTISQTMNVLAAYCEDLNYE